MSVIKKTINGLRIHYYQNAKTKITSFGYRFCFGSRAENRKEYGLFHMLEHNIFKGTETFNDPTEITRFFNERSYDINAMTNYNFTSYYAEGLTDFLSKMISCEPLLHWFFKAPLILKNLRKKKIQFSMSMKCMPMMPMQLFLKLVYKNC